MKRGEVWLIEFSDAKGHEQTGTRPAILLSEEIVNVNIIVPLTSNILAARFPFTFEIAPSAKNGLSTESVALVFQLRAIDKSRLVKRLGEIELATLNQVEKLIRKMVQI